MSVQIIEVPAYVAPGYPPCSEFHVYRVAEGRDAPQFAAELIRVCPSIGMAREVAASLEV
jgi:hypothetical protein